MGDRQLKLGIFPAQNLLQIQVRAQAELIAVARRTVVVIAAMQVGTHFADIVEGEGVAFCSSSLRVPFQSPNIHLDSLSNAGFACTQVARPKAVRPPIRLRAFARP